MHKPMPVRRSGYADKSYAVTRRAFTYGTGCSDFTGTPKLQARPLGRLLHGFVGTSYLMK
jgi:hypothetical protein